MLMTIIIPMFYHLPLRRPSRMRMIQVLVDSIHNELYDAEYDLLESKEDWGRVKEEILHRLDAGIMNFNIKQTELSLETWMLGIRNGTLK